MKTILVFVLLSVSLISLSCKKSSTLQGPDDGSGQPAVYLAVGNQYNWDYAHVHSGIRIDYEQADTISRDSIINGNRYFKFSTGELIRASGDTVFAYKDAAQIIYYRMNVSVGQTVEFLGYLLAVIDVEIDTVFQHPQRVIYVSNEASPPDTLIHGSYTAIFGVLSYGKQYGTSSVGQDLVGARLDTVTYGMMP